MGTYPELYWGTTMSGEMELSKLVNGTRGEVGRHIGLAAKQAGLEVDVHRMAFGFAPNAFAVNAPAAATTSKEDVALVYFELPEEGFVRNSTARISSGFYRVRQHFSNNAPQGSLELIKLSNGESIGSVPVDRPMDKTRASLHSGIIQLPSGNYHYIEVDWGTGAIVILWGRTPPTE